MGRGLAAAIAGLAGFAVMALELVAVRLLAPWFGDSAYVWTNVLGVVLAALAAGAWIGGRAAAREVDAARRLLCWTLVVAALLVALIPLLAAPLAGWLLPRDLPLEAAMAGMVRGSLVATLVLFALPMALLGAVTPLLVSLCVRAGVAVGSAAGTVGAASTLGSLAGTFAATHLLVPGVGSRATVLCSAAVLAVAAALGRRARIGAAATLVLAAGLGWQIAGTAVRSAAPGVDVLAERETRYQFVQVLRQLRDGREVRSLAINEGLDSFHSLKVDGDVWTGAYYDWHAAVPLLAGCRPDQPLRLLSLGAAAGTFARLMQACYPAARTVEVELDPEVVELGRAWFGGYGARAEVAAGVDARLFTEHAEPGSFDGVLVDCYAHQVYIPAHVASAEFFAAVHRALRDGGVVSVNVGGLRRDDPVVDAVARTMASVFGEARAFAVPQSRNFVVLARRGAPVDPALLESVPATVDAGLRAVCRGMTEPRRWRTVTVEADRGFAPLADDRPALDELLHRSLAYHPDVEAPLAIGGDEDATVAEERAASALRAEDAEAALAAIASARDATPLLRLYAGDARWLQRAPTAAVAEYRAASAGADAALQPVLEARIAGAEEMAATAARGAEVAARNAWLAAMLAAGLLCAAVAMVRLVA